MTTEARGGAISQAIQPATAGNGAAPRTSPIRSDAYAGGDQIAPRDESAAAPGDAEDGGGASSAHRTWAVSFVDTTLSNREQRFGSIVLHHLSRWITMVVGNAWEAHRSIPEKAQVCVDLTNASPRYGCRFWVLADQEDEIDDEEDTGDIGMEEHDVATAPKFSDETGRCGPTILRRKELLDLRLSKKALRPITGIRPWFGPKPKVILQRITLSDFVSPAWIKVKKKNKKIKPPVRSLDRQTAVMEPVFAGRQARTAFLNDVSADCGPATSVINLGLQESGYEAQTAAAQGYFLPHAIAASSQVECNTCISSPPRVRTRGKPGFPSLGTGRAARLLPSARASKETMAGRGQAPRPLQQSTKPTGQGSRAVQQEPPGKVTAAGGAEMPPTARQDANRLQPRGRWGDDGIDAYGDGQHRGSSSAGGGRGYAWQGSEEGSLDRRAVLRRGFRAPLIQRGGIPP
ncbi:hypothetical protein ZWY2020_031637 [Hordeum vulgare]|nr:hypothetical protein ZWY2020_031637 [Hordeum vulgare]